MLRAPLAGQCARNFHNGLPRRRLRRAPTGNVFADILTPIRQIIDHRRHDRGTRRVEIAPASNFHNGPAICFIFSSIFVFTVEAQP